MRTTVDIDPHVLERLREMAHAEGISFKAMLNRALQRGLDPTAPVRTPYECPTFSLGEPLRALDKALAVADALEDDEVARKLSQRQ
jgi:putative aminopeptidase FrvX